MHNYHPLEMLAAGRAVKAGIPSRKFTATLIADHGNVIGRKLNQAKVNLDDATQHFDEATRQILSASNALHDQMDGLSKKAKESVGRAKDMAAQMTDAMNKVTKMIGPDFDNRLKQLAELTDCLERLSVLQKSGVLTSMIDAVSSAKK